MSGSNGRACPECGTSRRPDGTPSCACNQRASDALRDARTAEAAAAEDFDPLRIRPYVELGGTPPTAKAPAAPEESSGKPAGAAAHKDTGAITPDGTLRRPGVPEGGGGSGAAPEPTERPTAADAAPEPTERPTAADARAVPLAPAGTGQPSGPADEAGEADQTTRLPASGARGPDETMPLGAVQNPTMRLGPVSAAPLSPEAPDGEPPRRRRRTVLLAAGGAVVAVAAAAGLAGGLFSYDRPQRDAALPDGIRASVPEGPSRGTPAPGSTASAPAPATSTAPSPSTSPSPSASPSSASASPSASPTPSRTTTARATTSASPGPDGDGQGHQAQVLRRGDEGPEVKELQLRLRRLNLYIGPADGVYDGQVESSVTTYQLARGISQDDRGVYGPATRAALESETSEP
ncbi:peptidoglycan-binding protein [Streptomyces sp. NPDC047079]|uniref:peptidoglycan-binding protein n=1 Tax=Streptomyces sp. NPDC047079 TaxID=3154607 RepID=UPI0033C8DCB1